VVEVFVAQNSDRSRPSRTAQIGLKPSSSRTTTSDASLICDGHRAKGEIGYPHLENLQNLAMLPADSFEIVCCPVEVHRASAGWTRAVTILPA